MLVLSLSVILVQHIVTQACPCDSQLDECRNWKDESGPPCKPVRNTKLLVVGCDGTNDGSRYATNNYGSLLETQPNCGMRCGCELVNPNWPISADPCLGDTTEGASKHDDVVVLEPDKEQEADSITQGAEN